VLAAPSVSATRLSLGGDGLGRHARGRRVSFGQRLDLIGPLPEQQVANEEVGPRLEAQISTVEPAERIRARQEVPLVPERVGGALEPALVGPLAARVGLDQTGKAFRQSTLEGLPLAPDHRGQQHVEPRVRAGRPLEHGALPTRIPQTVTCHLASFRG
jgi:hypothetical protein